MFVYFISQVILRTLPLKYGDDILGDGGAHSAYIGEVFHIWNRFKFNTFFMTFNITTN